MTQRERKRGTRANKIAEHIVNNDNDDGKGNRDCDGGGSVDRFDEFLFFFNFLCSNFSCILVITFYVHIHFSSKLIIYFSVLLVLFFVRREGGIPCFFLVNRTL